MLNIIKSNWLRTKREPVRWVLFIAPILYSLLFSIYVYGSNSLEGFEVYGFFISFAILSTFSLSFFVPMIYEADKSASYYVNDVKFAISRKKTFLGKFLLISFLYALIILIASVIFLLFWILLKKSSINYSELLTIIGILFFTILPLIAIYQYMHLKFGQTGSILLGIFITLAAILLGTTGLGSIIWKYLPFVWPIKLMYLLAKGEITLNICIIFMILSLSISALLLLIVATFFDKLDLYEKTED
ncbi:lantibiotic ABC transporter permease [uncultured Anaerococcus sp.]|uniref:lantibiotic ABC transporter permease n=1 Tax=uncultured Anaerococcus sp. TaxID=293428 RepID=UPI002619510B|nr:lantibiotic ABC transporter permease [uncultured Anaerococcus sp.]